MDGIEPAARARRKPDICPQPVGRVAGVALIHFNAKMRTVANLPDRGADLVYERRHEAREINLSGVARGIGYDGFSSSHGDGV